MKNTSFDAKIGRYLVFSAAETPVKTVRQNCYCTLTYYVFREWNTWILAKNECKYVKSKIETLHRHVRLN